MFETFVEELRKYDEGVHRLYPAASISSINAAESKLGVEFPPEYRAFLRSWNGGLLFAKEFFDILRREKVSGRILTGLKNLPDTFICLLCCRDVRHWQQTASGTRGTPTDGLSDGVVGVWCGAVSEMIDGAVNRG